MNQLDQAGNASGPVKGPLRYKAAVKPLSLRSEPPTIYSARHPAMPWIAAESVGDMEDEDWARSWVHDGAHVDSHGDMAAPQYMPNKSRTARKWQTADESIARLLSTSGLLHA